MVKQTCKRLRYQSKIFNILAIKLRKTNYAQTILLTSAWKTYQIIHENKQYARRKRYYTGHKDNKIYDKSPAVEDQAKILSLY